MAANSDQIAERIRRAEDYLNAEHNLYGQQQWYDRKATTNKNWNMRLGLIIIAAGAATSVVQLWAPASDDGPVHWSTWLTAGLGALIILAKGIDRLWNFDSNWATYRQAAEGMKRERRLFINSAGPYTGLVDEEASYRLFIERTEEVIAAEEHTFGQGNWQKDKESSKSE